ncbi:hypothetical protein IJI69_01190 [Candidatus Saccharibacteria bacterium]|nr:hypothetical protein [Candidatus Saccharibacteria bacterium]
MKKILVYFSVILAMVMGVNMAAPMAVSAADDTDSCNATGVFFALRPWYHGLTEPINGKCEIKKPDGNSLPQFVWAIVLNILTDVMIMVGYVAIIMIAWGGYLYMFSRGMPDRAERGKKTLIAAVAGLAIAMLASVIMNTIVSILTNVS